MWDPGFLLRGRAISAWDWHPRFVEEEDDWQGSARAFYGF